MKILLAFIPLLLLVGCENSFKTNLPQTASNTDNPSNPGTSTPVNGSKYFYYQYGELGYVDDTTLLNIPLHTVGSGNLNLIATNYRRPSDINNYFINYSPNKIYLFNSNTHAFTEIVSDSTGLAALASGNSLLTYDNNKDYSTYPSTSAVSANTYYGLNGTADSINGSSCTGLGHDYFLCNNSGTNPNKAILLKKDSQGNPGFKTFAVSTNYPSLALLDYSKKLGIIGFYDISNVPQKYFSFNYALETLTEISIPVSNYSVQFFRKDNAISIMVRSYMGDDFKFYLMNEDTGALVNPVTSSIPSNNSGSLFNYYWYGYEVSPDKTKHYLYGYVSGGSNEIAVIEMTSNSYNLRDLNLSANQRFFFVNGKFYTQDNNQLKSVDIANAGALEADLTLNNSIKAAYCATLGEVSNCPMLINSISQTGEESIDGYSYLFASVELNGASEFIRIGVKPSAPLVLKKSSDSDFYIWYNLEKIRKDGITIFANQNPAE